MLLTFKIIIILFRTYNRNSNLLAILMVGLPQFFGITSRLGIRISIPKVKVAKVRKPNYRVRKIVLPFLKSYTLLVHVLEYQEDLMFK